jgi:hypothetical protein
MRVYGEWLGAVAGQVEAAHGIGDLLLHGRGVVIVLREQGQRSSIDGVVRSIKPG